jgi:FkbH-like protein
MPDHPDLAVLRARFAAATPGPADIFEAGERIAALAAEGAPQQRIAVLGSLTTDFIARAVAVAAVLEGVLPAIYQAPYGSYVQEVLDPTSGLNRFKPDLVLLAPDWRDVVDDVPVGAAPAAVADAVAGKVDLFRHLWERLAAAGCRIVQHTLVPPARAWGGVAERLTPASPLAQVRAVNEALLAAGRGRVAWVDMERLAGEVGIRNFAPERFFHTARLGMENRHLPLYLPAFRAAWRLATGRAKKVLALDLDNTLWGGVIGDDGVEGIRLGPGSPAGEAFAEWQAYAHALAGRGIVLAACSKNDPAVAATGFDHPASRLKRADFAAFECSWNDKAQGLANIARTLNLGLDSIVFCDDNPAECALVREALPEVAVVELGSDPTRFIDLLDAGHWFDLAQYTAEDFGRGEMYTARARALDEAAAAPDMGSFLRGLAMTGRVWRPGEPDMSRVAQLEMKTNQFNLTTRRYSEAALRAFLARDDAVVLAFRLADRFGDHGLTATLIALHEGDALRVDSWLMSCRVFSRSAEQFILRALLAIAAERGAARIVGEYIPSPRNGVVADLWQRLGFREEAGLWVRDVAGGAIDGLDTAIAQA